MKLDKTLHFSVCISGDDSDKIDIMSYLSSLPEDWKFEVTSARNNIYFTKIKASGKETSQ